MHDLPTQPKVIEISNLHDHLVMWMFASERLTKYGFQKPEATMLFDTLKKSCEKLMEKDGEFKFQLQSFIKEHSIVNGLVNMETVKSLYDMILDHARSYLNTKAEAKRAIAGKASSDGCFLCGSKDHWYSDCPKPNEKGYGKGQQGKAGSNYQQSGKGKAKGQFKGQQKGQPPVKQPMGVGKGKQKVVRKEVRKV